MDANEKMVELIRNLVNSSDALKRLGQDTGLLEPHAESARALLAELEIA